MTIKHLDQHLAERKHITTLPLSALADTRLGIDISFYLRQFLESNREPFLAATGGIPLTLTSVIEDDLRALEKLRIKPVFVFPGLLPNKRQKPNVNEHADACRDRREAWAAYEKGNADDAAKLFEGRSGISQWDLWRSVLRIFRHRNVDFVIAPYTSWAQLIYLQRHPKSYAHAVFGSTELFLYPNVDRVILSLDLHGSAGSPPSFTYASKRSLLSDLGLTEDQFLDTAILAGFENTQTFPVTVHETTLKPIVDMVKYYKTGHAAVSAFSDHPAVKAMYYTDHYARTRAMIKYSLVLSSEGLALPLPLAIPTPSPSHGHSQHHNFTAADIPQDLHEVFTHRLPDEIYFYLSRGLISPQVLVWLTSGQIIENPPLDNGETNEYKRFIKEVITEGATGPRATSLALISSVTNTFWAGRKVLPHFWFENALHNTKPVPHNGPGTTQLVDRVSGWKVSSAIVEEELRRQNSSTIDFALCLGATSTEKLALRTRKPSVPSMLEKKDEIVANVIWRFLELRGFLLHTHMHTPLGRAMHTAIKASRVNDKFQDPLYLFLELVRAGVMHGNLWSARPHSGGPSFGTDEEKKCMLLIMRVMSIVPLNSKQQPWSGPLSRELLVFNSFLRSLSRALRSMVELTAMNMLVSQHARRARDDLLDVALSLPFHFEVNTGFGILAKVYLDALVSLYGSFVVDSNAEGVQDAKEGALETCDEAFGDIRYPRAEVERGFRFWDTALLAIRTLNSEGTVVSELADQFEAANAWLAPMRP